MKKIISFILVCSMVLTFVPSIMAAESGTVCDDYSINRIFGLGLIPHTTRADFQEDATITRGELAWVIETISKYQEMTNSTEFTWQFYGNSSLDNDILKLPPAPPAPTFQDVPASYWAYEIIEAVYAEGLMNGVSSTSFAPDNNVTIEQLAKCFVSILGYDSKAQYLGGYPAGYTKVANDLGLLRGIKSAGYVTNADLIVMIDNALDVRLMAIDGVVGDGNNEYLVHTSSEETFLTGILGLKRAEGVMTDNSVTSLFGKSKIDENQFLVDNVILKANPDFSGSLYDLIGREVECYYVADKKSKKADQIVYGALTGYDKATTIDAENFVGYSNGVISYFEDDKTEKISLSSLFALIYNGQALTAYDSSIFDIDNGRIIVVEGSGNGSDVVIIDEYDTWYVSGVDQKAQMVFNRLVKTEKNGSGESVKVGPAYVDFDEYKFITVVKPDGSAGEFADITPGTLLDVAINGDSLTIYINGKSVSALIDGTAVENGKTVLLSGDNEYVISTKYSKYEDKLNYKIGDELILYFDKFGTVSWMEINKESTVAAPVNYKVAYIMDIATDTQDMKNVILIRMFDCVEKKEVIYKCDTDRVVVSDSYGKEIIYRSANELSGAVGGYRGIIRYLVDDKFNITYIELPITDIHNQQDGKLTLIEEVADTDKDSGEEGSGTKFRYNNFGGKAISNANTLVFCVDTANTDNEDGYDVRTVGNTFTNEKYYNGYKIYTTNKGSRLGEFIVYFTKSKATTLNYNTGINFAIVKSVTNVYDEETSESVRAIKAFSSTISTSTTANNNDVLKLDPECKIYTPLSGEFKGQIEPGDIIFYGVNSEGFVDEIRIFWDQNGVNPDSPDGAPGTIVDSKGYYGVDDNEPAFGNDNVYTGDLTALPNPLCLATDATKGHVAKKSDGFGAGPLAIHYGFLARYRDSAIELTSQDITIDEYDPNGLDGKHITRVWTTPTNSIVVTLSGKNNVEVLQGGSVALNPFRPQDEYSQNCSRLIVFSNYAMMSKLIVINGYFEN